MPSTMPRICAMSGVTFAAGRMPPLPGFAPWLSFTSIIRTWSWAAMARRRPSSSCPSSSRHPYLAVPIWKTRSAPPSRWYGDNPPSPVFSQQPAARAPRDSAITAGREIAPLLIAEMWK